MAEHDAFWAVQCSACGNLPAALAGDVLRRHAAGYATFLASLPLSERIVAWMPKVDDEEADDG
jgi:hypothetical protein